jgi:hypothetical protein
MNLTCQARKRIFLLTFILFIACAPKKYNDRPLSLTKDTKDEDVRGRIYRPAFEALVAQGKISYTDNKTSTRLNVTIALDKDEFLFIDAYHFFGTLLYQLKIKENRMYVFYPRENTYYSGKLTRENLYRLFNINLAFMNFYALASDPLMMINPEHENVSRISDGFLLEDLTTKIYINNELFITKLVLSEGEHTSMIIIYRNYTRFGDRLFPQELEIIDHTRDSRATIRFTKVKFMNSIDKKRFDITIPSDVILRDLE